MAGLSQSQTETKPQANSHELKPRAVASRLLWLEGSHLQPFHSAIPPVRNQTQHPQFWGETESGVCCQWLALHLAAGNAGSKSRLTSSKPTLAFPAGAACTPVPALCGEGECVGSCSTRMALPYRDPSIPHWKHCSCSGRFHVPRAFQLAPELCRHILTTCICTGSHTAQLCSPLGFTGGVGGIVVRGGR